MVNVQDFTNNSHRIFFNLIFENRRLTVKYFGNAPMMIDIAVRKRRGNSFFIFSVENCVSNTLDIYNFHA